MIFRRLPKPKLHWSDNSYSQEDVDKYEQSLINVAISEAKTPNLAKVIVYLMETHHREAPPKKAGAKKVWNTHLQILLACQFELISAKTLELKATQILEKFPQWNRILELDKKSISGTQGLIKHRNAGLNAKLFSTESKQYLKNPALIVRALEDEISRIKLLQNQLDSVHPI